MNTYKLLGKRQVEFGKGFIYFKALAFCRWRSRLPWSPGWGGGGVGYEAGPKVGRSKDRQGRSQ
jgi:hypothetical protein